MDKENRPGDHVISYYDTHPINEQQILKAIKTKIKNRQKITSNSLCEFDQDHFGGLNATKNLAQLTDMKRGKKVLDVCSGVGGPARFFADKFDCEVTGIDLTKSRHETAIKLTNLVGLQQKVKFVLGNATNMPFTDEKFDIVIGQEAWCHIPDKEKLIKECCRVLKVGGRMAFTDIVKNQFTSVETLKKLTKEMTFNNLASDSIYKALLTKHGFKITSLVDLSERWAEILVKRLDMYKQLGDETSRIYGAARQKEWDKVYTHFVDTYQSGELGGVQILATRN